jgi:ankyrin repeat protein
MKRRIQPQIGAFSGVLIALFGLSSPADAAKPPIPVAAFEGDLPSIRAEIEAGTDLDTHNAKGLTALMLASGRGHLPIIETVLKAGANIDAQSKHGWSALWLAAAKGQTETVQVLVQAGANREAQDQLERPPLWLAAARRTHDRGL